MDGPAPRTGPFMHEVAEHLLTSTGNSFLRRRAAMDSRERLGWPGNLPQRTHQERKPGHHASHPTQSRACRDPRGDQSTSCQKLHARTDLSTSVERQSASG